MIRTLHTTILFVLVTPLVFGGLNTPFPTFGRIAYVDRDDHPVSEASSINTYYRSIPERVADYKHKCLCKNTKRECSDKQIAKFANGFSALNINSSIMKNRKVLEQKEQMDALKKLLSLVIYKEFVEYGLDTAKVYACRDAANKCRSNSFYWLGWASGNSESSRSKVNKIAVDVNELLDELDIVHASEFRAWCIANRDEYNKMRSEFDEAVKITASIQAEVDKKEAFEQMKVELERARIAAEEARLAAEEAAYEADRVNRCLNELPPPPPPKRQSHKSWWPK